MRAMGEGNPLLARALYFHQKRVAHTQDSFAIIRSASNENFSHLSARPNTNQQQLLQNIYFIYKKKGFLIKTIFINFLKKNFSNYF